MDQALGQEVGRRLPIAEAAKQLGMTTSATRQRVKRGSIPAVKGEDGCWYVLVDEACRVLGSSRGSTAPPDPESTQVTVKVANQGRPSSSPEPLVARLTDEVDYLRQQIGQRDKELEQRAEELRRKDIMLAEFARAMAELKHRLPELPAVGSAETASWQPTEGAAAKPSWWRRLIYGPNA